MLERIAVAAALLIVSAADAMAAATLANNVVTAQFGERGLAELTDSGLKTTFHFSQDAFSVVVGGREIRSDALPTPTVHPEGRTLRYRYISGVLSIDVIYEVQPDWRFLSKRLRITAPAGAPLRVDRVEVFRSELVEQPRDIHVCANPSEELKTRGCGGFLRFDNSTGLLALVQNPFLDFSRVAGGFAISYAPEMEWNTDWGPFESDRGLLAPYALTTRRLPAAMIPEWKAGPEPALTGMDEAEVEAYTNCVRAFVLDRHPRPVNLLVGWCVNDYQIDISTPEGRDEYKRVIDRAVEMGANHVLFAPANSAVSLRALSTDDWSWENLLWLGLGQKIRKGEWKIGSGEMPPSIAEMLAHARSRNTGLMAYVYPVLGFLADQHPEWIVPGSKPARASLGVRSYQDWLIDALVAFAKHTGISGYSFDHTFLTYEGTSRYAQWRGWRRVMEELRRQMPDVVIDGRQAYHMYGPWSWLAGTYPHPTYSDEQPESFTPFPDLHFDRVSANRLRYTAWRYRNVDFAPAELMPGFITHQTPRIDEKGELPVRIEKDAATGLNEQIPLAFRRRDWDYLGWRYSLLSSVAVAGLNNVLNMIPARDTEEYRNFSAADKAEFRKWIDWTASNQNFLRHTRTIIGQPGIGKIDGTSAIIDDRGYVFLFNPNGRRLNAEFLLDGSIGLKRGSKFILKELYPLEGRLVGKPGEGQWSAGDRVAIPMDGTSVVVLHVLPAPAKISEPLLFGAPGSVVLKDGDLELTGVRGERGSEEELSVVLPPGASVKTARVNGRSARIQSISSGLAIVRTRFAGQAFRRSEQLGSYDPGFAGGAVSGKFSIPKRVFDQLAERRKNWPIPWTDEDRKATWLVPERLLLYVQMAEPDDRLEALLQLDGKEFPLQRAYSSIRTHRPSFVGFYADVSSLKADREYSYELRLPKLNRGQFQGLFFDNVETEYTDAIEP